MMYEIISLKHTSAVFFPIGWFKKKIEKRMNCIKILNYIVICSLLHVRMQCNKL